MREFPKLNNIEAVRRNALRSFYDRLFDVEVLKLGQFKNVNFHEMLLDTGLKRSISWTSPEGEVLSSNEVNILNRIGLICRIMNQYVDESGELNNKPFNILFFDIENFQGYNISDKSEVRGGDYIINMIAHLLNLACSQFIHKNHLSGNINIIPARYGGDEFSVLVEGDILDHELQRLAQEIKDNIAELQGYYKDARGNIKTRNVAIKNNAITIFPKPTDPAEQKIFLHFLQNNSILSQEEIDRIKQDPGKIEFDEINSCKVTYPDGVSTLEQKLRWLTPRVGKYESMADQLISLDKEFQTDVYKKKALKFFELIFHNDIFTHKMVPYGDLVEFITNGNYAAVCTFKVKFLKDVNAKLNMARGDELLINFFDLIINELKKFDINADDMDISRKGGVFIVAIKDISQKK